MSDLRTYLHISVKGDAAGRTRELAGAFDRLGERGRANLGMLSRSMSMMSGGLDRLGNRYSALLTGAAGAGAAKYVGDLQERMNYLGITAEKSAEDMDRLKKKVFEVAQAPDIRIDPAALLDAVDTIVEKTGDLDMAEENLRNIGLAMRATKASGQDVGAWVAQLAEKFNIKSSDGILAAIDHSVNAGKAGAFAFKDLATQGERVTAAYAAMGRTGPQAAAELDAMLQMIRKGVGSPEMAATAFEAMMRTLADAEKLKKLKAKGIRIMDPEDPKRMRAATDILKDVITRTNGDMVKMSEIFDAEALRAFTAAAAEFKTTGGFKSLEGYLDVAADGATLKADAAAANVKNINAALTSLTTAGRQFADANLSEPIGKLADLLASMEPEKVQATMKALAWGAGALGGLVVANKAVGLAGSIAGAYRFVRGGKGVAGVAGAAAGLGGIAGPTPVVVMNWPGGPASAWAPGGAAAGGATAGRGAGAGRLAGRAGRWMGKLGGLGGRAFLPLALLEGGMSMAGSLMAGDVTGAAGAGGRTAGSIAGAAAGAAIGSVVPVVGTAIGGLAGAIVGGLGGEALFRSIAEWLQSDKDRKMEVQAEATLRIEGAPPGTRVVGMRGSPGLDLNVDVGRTMAGP